MRKERADDRVRNSRTAEKGKYLSGLVCVQAGRRDDVDALVRLSACFTKLWRGYSSKTGKKYGLDLGSLRNVIMTYNLDAPSL